MDASRRAIPIFGAWTLLVWLSRVRNVWADDDLSGGGRASRVAVAAVFIALAAVIVVAFYRPAADPNRARWALRVLCSWTIAFWIVRGAGILLDDHDAGFLTVHAVLMAVSIGLATWAWPRAREDVPSAGRVA